jgi:hypothetical protein
VQKIISGTGGIEVADAIVNTNSSLLYEALDETEPETIKQPVVVVDGTTTNCAVKSIQVPDGNENVLSSG